MHPHVGKQTAAADSDGDTTEGDDREDSIAVPVGFVRVAEMLGILNAPATSSGPRDELELLVECLCIVHSHSTLAEY